MSTRSRKNDHIDICLTQDVHSGLRTGFDQLHFSHHALPELALDDIDTSTSLFGKKVDLPLLVSSMTGGTRKTVVVNARLAEAAEAAGCALGLGSMRIVLEDRASLTSFKIRRYAPRIPLFANIGAVQLNYGVTPSDCMRLVEWVDADGLILHLNPLQEALQPEGNTNFRDLSKKIKSLCKAFQKPIIVKEVGWGLSRQDARILLDCGVAAIDVAGAGGTSWSEVEKHRINDAVKAHIAGSFKEWGIPTVESLLNVRSIDKRIPLIASGGLQNGIDLAKSIALGANLGGFARTLLHPASISTAAVLEAMRGIQTELKVTMFVTGSKLLRELQGKLQ